MDELEGPAANGMAVRLLDNYLPDAWFGEDHMWAVHGLIGLVLTLAGVVLWAKRKPAKEETVPG